MRLTFTLQSAYTGSTYVAGPFNISGRTSGGINYQLSTGVTKTQLTTGHTVDTVYETITGGTIVSTGSCGTSQDWSLTPAPTATPTSTFGYTTLTGVFPFNSNGSAQITITNNSGATKYLWLYMNSTYTNTGTLAGSVTDQTLSETKSINEPITAYNQTELSSSYWVFATGTSHVFTITKTSPNSGGYVGIQYADTTVGTKYNLPAN
jgi:hypothetical protein